LWLKCPTAFINIDSCSSIHPSTYLAEQPHQENKSGTLTINMTRLTLLSFLQSLSSEHESSLHSDELTSDGGVLPKSPLGKFENFENPLQNFGNFGNSPFSPASSSSAPTSFSSSSSSSRPPSAMKSSFARVELPSPQVLSCQTTGADIRWTGELARVVCPSRCESEPTAVALGAGVHPLKAPVCISAIVDKVMPYFGGEIMLKQVPGLPSYSSADASVAKSLAVVGEPGPGYHIYAIDTIDTPQDAPWEMSINCSPDFNFLGMKQTGESIPVRCSRACEEEGKLEGSGIYTPRSNVCRAAHHAGIIGTDGGHVMVTRQHGQDYYFGRRAHGDQSNDAKRTDASYTLSYPTPDYLARTRKTPRFGRFL